MLLQNKSVKLGIIAYARANGINLNESDLDILRATILATENPNLDPLVEHGVTRLKEEYGVDRIDKALQEMQTNQFNCDLGSG